MIVDTTLDRPAVVKLLPDWQSRRGTTRTPKLKPRLAAPQSTQLQKAEEHFKKTISLKPSYATFIELAETLQLNR